MSEQLNFEQMIEESMKNINVKETIEGTIININKKGEVIIDIGYKADGIIPRDEYSYNESADPSEELKIGDKITAEVIKMNDGEGNVLLSTKRYKMKEAQKELEEKFKNNEVLEERITEITDKGFIISKEGYNIFIPISLSGITRSENIKDYKDKVVRFRLIECKFRPRRIIGSIKAVLDEEKNKKIDKFWNEAEVGKKYKGKVIFYKVNADKEKDLCSHFSVQALPTLFFIPVGGKPIIEVGATPEKYVQIIEEQLLK